MPDSTQPISPLTSDSQTIENVDGGAVFQGENISGDVNINIDNSQQISPTIAPSPTKLPFAPATTDEALIIVPLYDDRSEGQLRGVNPSSQIYDLILKAAIENDESNVRVEYYEQVIDNSEDAKKLGEKYSAKIVFWGWYNNLKVRPYVEVIGKKTVQGDGLPIVTSTPLAFYFIEEIPTQAAYLGLFMLGMTHVVAESEQELYQAIRFFDAALVALVASTQTNPWEAYIWRANCYLILNEYSKALKDYDQGIHFNPNDASAYFNRGIAHGALNLHEEAIADYTKAIQIDSDRVEAYGARGNEHSALGDKENAIADYSEALVIAPDHTGIRNNRAVAYSASGRHVDAIADYTEVLRLDPDYTSIYFGRGNAHGALGEYEDAIENYDEALQVAPDDARVFLHWEMLIMS